MELFDLPADPAENLLPYNGIVNYYGKVLPYEKATEYFKELYHNTTWKHDESIKYGKIIVAKRQVAWFGERNFDYAYSGTTKKAKPIPEKVRELKALVEQKTGVEFNSVLLNLYESGEVGIAWHADKEAYFGKEVIIASLTLGAERKFGFKHRETKETVWKILEHGSLLVMRGTTQNYWLHHLPPTKKVMAPRINLTFRKSVE